MEIVEKIERAFAEVVYIDENHTYTIENKLANYSVTKLLSKYTKPFDVKKFSEQVAQKEGIDVETVIRKWDFTRDIANIKGTEFHKYAENCINRKKNSIDSSIIKKFFREDYPDFKTKYSELNCAKDLIKLVENFKDFYKLYKNNYIPVKMELVVGDKDAMLAGTMEIGRAHV